MAPAIQIAKDWKSLDRERKERLALMLAEKRKRMSSPFRRMFPDEDIIGPDGAIEIHARRKYFAQCEFFEAGARYRERCLMAANRLGKTVCAAYELTCHLTGDYPHWWVGRRFDGPIRAWAAGEVGKTTRDIVQRELLGSVSSGQTKVSDGAGMIPAHLIASIRPASGGVPDLMDTVKVRHVSGKESTLGFKSYGEGTSAFAGTAQHVIWFDEEPPIDVYGEALIRTATTDGVVMITFTPLNGWTDTVKQFMRADEKPGD